MLKVCRCVPGFRVLCVATLWTGLLAGSMPTAVGQLEGRLAPKPIGTGYARDLNQLRVLEYVKRLANRLQIGKTMVQAFDNETQQEMLKSTQPDVPTPVTGTAWYLVQGLIPSMETVSFLQTADAADARRLLKARSEMFGGAEADLQEIDDGRFKLSTTSSWTIPTPQGQTAAEYVEQQNRNHVNSSRSFQMSWNVQEENGKQVVKQSMKRTEYSRIHGDLLFNAGFEELLEMELPSVESLTSQISSSHDMGMEWSFDRIPAGIKQLGWGMLSGGAGVQMQQRDDEPAAEAGLRRSAIQFGLDVVKAVMFDVQEANGWLRFATADDPSIRGELNFVTRRSSGLTKQLEELSSGRTRFGAILRDGAPATLHVCVKAFADEDSLPAAAGAWLQHALAEATSHDSAATAAAAQIAETFNGIGDHGTLEAFLKVGWTEATDGVIYGGLQVDDNPRLLRSLQVLATADGGVPQELNLIEKNGHEVLQLVLPATVTTWIADQSSLQLTHLYVTHQNSCLWLAVGSEDAWQILDQSIQRCADTGLAVKAPLATAFLDVERWMQLPEDDPVGVGNLLRWLDANMREFPPGPMSFSFGGPSPDWKPAALLIPVFELGGDQQAEFTIIADKSGVQASLQFGEALANYYAARMIVLQDRQFSRINQREMEAAAERAAEASDAN